MLPTEQFNDQRDYCAAVAIAKSLLAEGLLTSKEYDSINNTFIKQHRPVIKFVGAAPPIPNPQKPDLT